jgi:hypothetical protein
LIFEVWSNQNNGSHKIYGRFRSTVRELKDSIGNKFEITKKQGIPLGSMTFDKFDLIVRPSMVDFLRSGWKISLSVAIDFTASNGELSDPSSLHYIDRSNPLKMTAYELAIQQVGNILEAYDNDKMFPVFGFGAKPRYMGIEQVLHCFNLNGMEDPSVHGVSGILEAYRNAVTGGIGLYGPTNFAP